MHKVQSVFDDSFKKYGAVMSGVPSDAIRAAAALIPMPEKGRRLPALDPRAGSHAGF